MHCHWAGPLDIVFRWTPSLTPSLLLVLVPFLRVPLPICLLLRRGGAEFWIETPMDLSYDTI